MTTEPTPSELGRRLDEVRGDLRHISDRFDRLPDQQDLANVASAWMTSLTALEQHTATRVDHLNRRVDALDAWQTWAVRILLGALLVAGVTALIAYGGRV